MSVRTVALTAYRQALGAVAASAAVGLVAGLVLTELRAEFRALPGLLVLVPALLATRGNVYGTLGARLATALHQGLLPPRLDPGERRLRVAVIAALATGLLANAFAALAVVPLLGALGQPVAPAATLLAVALLAGLLAGLLLAAVVVSVVVLAYRRGYDPDTLVGPTVTTAGDVFGVVTLALAVRAVLAV